MVSEEQMDRQGLELEARGDLYVHAREIDLGIGGALAGIPLLALSLVDGDSRGRKVTVCFQAGG